MKRRKRGGYFHTPEGSPGPVVVDAHTRVKFNECDVMGIVWFGNYPRYFEEGSAAVSRKCGMTYLDFKREGLMAPIIQSHVDYHSPLFLDEEFFIRTALYWSEAAVLEKEYKIIKADGTLAASGYTVQLFIDMDGRHLAVSPALLVRSRARWLKGDFH